MRYPETCFRGIANYPNCIGNDGKPNDRIFKPHSNQQPNEGGWLEFSINWEDDDIVEEFTRDQRKPDDTLHFIKGIVRMIREQIDNIKKNPRYTDFLDYERQPLDNNPYHGNILIKNVLKANGKPDKLFRNEIVAKLLTTIKDDIIPPPQNSNE